MFFACFSRFDGLLDGTEYTIALSTELDGKTITQVTMLAMKGCSSSGKSDKSDKKDAKSWHVDSTSTFSLPYTRAVR